MQERKASAGKLCQERGALPSLVIYSDEDKHGTLQHSAVFTVHEAVLRVDLSRCVFLTYLLPLFSWEAHEERCSGRAASFQRELDSVIPLAEPLRT